MRRLLSKILLVAITVVTLLCSFTYFLLPSQVKAAASINIYPPYGPPGDTIYIDGTGFPIAALVPIEVTISWDGVPQRNLSTVNGTFVTTLDIPEGANLGTHTITASSGSISASRDFLLVYPTIQVNPIESPLYTDIEITGQYWYEDVELYVDGNYIGYAVPEDSFISKTFDGDSLILGPGEHTIGAVQPIAEGVVSSSAKFTYIAPTIIPSQPSGPPGSEVDIHGENWPGPDTIGIYWGVEGELLDQLNHPTTGPFDITIYVPSDSIVGTTYTIYARGSLVNAYAGAPFTVIEPLPLPPPPPQTIEYWLTISVNGNGTTDPPEGAHPYTVVIDVDVILIPAVPITAKPDAGWEFVDWTGDVADPNSPNTMVGMDRDKTVMANFHQTTTPAPPAPAPPGDGRTSPPIPPWWWVFILVLIPPAIIIPRVRRNIRRNKWQKKAKEEPPEEPCKHGSGYCQYETKISLERCKVRSIKILSKDTSSRRKKEKEITEGDIIDDFNKVLISRQSGQNPEKLREKVLNLSNAILLSAVKLLKQEANPQTVAIIGTLSGCKVKCEFTAKSCNKEQQWGKAKDIWGKTYKVNYTRKITTLNNIVASEPQVIEKRTPELTEAIMTFIDKICVPSWFPKSIEIKGLRDGITIPG